MKFLDGIFGITGKRLTVVKLQFLEQRQVCLLRRFQARQHSPHGRHLDGVGRDMLAADSVGVVILFVDLDFIVELGDVRNIDLYRTVAKRFHELIVLEFPVFRLVGMADDDFIDIGLRELLRFDLVLLACAEQVIQKCDFELQDFDELDDAAIGYIEFAVEVERASIRVGAIDGDLPIIDIAREFGRILVLFVLRLEGGDAVAILF